MPRPRKCRKVCCLPGSSSFGPLNDPSRPDRFIIMSVDEYETIRLIDLEGFSQEECASQMEIARTTVQRMYNDARKKLAEAIVYGGVLRIEGGHYDLYGENDLNCRKGCCFRHRNMIESE